MSSFRLPSVKASLRPDVGARDMYNIASGQPRAEEAMLGKAKPVPKAPPPPVVEDTEARQQDYGDALRRRRGRAASILTAGNSGAPMTASRVLLGS